MEMPTAVATASGAGRETVFYPPYCQADFIEMQHLIDDATMLGIAAMRFIHNDRITVTTVGA